MILGGILPFGCIFIQLFFVLNSIWSNQIYYMYEFLYFVYILLIVTGSTSAIMLCYNHLCTENYHWWWKSFLTSGFTAVYAFIYICNYFVTKTEIVHGAFLYFGYSVIIVFLLFLLTGTIGFIACFWFTLKIYALAKFDDEKSKIFTINVKT